MDAELQTIFHPLDDAIRHNPMDYTDLLDLIGQFAEHTPQVSQALAFHSRDYLVEMAEAEGDGVVIDFSRVISEAYRRTFFDPKYTPMYGTDSVFPGKDGLRKLVDYLVGNMQMDTAQAGRGSVHLPPASHQ